MVWSVSLALTTPADFELEKTAVWLASAGDLNWSPDVPEGTANKPAVGLSLGTSIPTLPGGAVTNAAEDFEPGRMVLEPTSIPGVTSVSTTRRSSRMRVLLELEKNVLLPGNKFPVTR